MPGSRRCSRASAANRRSGTPGSVPGLNFTTTMCWTRGMSLSEPFESRLRLSFGVLRNDADGAERDGAVVALKHQGARRRLAPGQAAARRALRHPHVLVNHL